MSDEEIEEIEEKKEIYFADAFLEILNTLPLFGTIQKEVSVYDENGEFWSLKLPQEWQNLTEFFSRTAKNLYSNNERVHAHKNELFTTLRNLQIIEAKSSNQQDVIQFFPPNSPTGLHITIAQPDRGLKVEGEIINFEIEKLHTYKCDNMKEPSIFKSNSYVAQYFSIKTRLVSWRNTDLSNDLLPTPTRSLCHITYACAGILLPSIKNNNNNSNIKSKANKNNNNNNSKNNIKSNQKATNNNKDNSKKKK